MLLAAKIGAGGLAFLVVLLLIAASVIIFVAMSGSLKRLRRSVDTGVFDEHAHAEEGAVDAGSDTAKPSSVSRDRSGPGDAAS